MIRINLRKKKLEKYFSILNEKEARELIKEIKEMRRKTEEKLLTYGNQPE